MKTKPLLIILIIVAGIAKESLAQNRTIDSLQTILKTAIEDTNKVNILNTLAWELKSNSPDTSIILSTQALKLAEKIKWQLGIGEAHNNLGWFNFLRGDYGHALEHYSQSLATFDAL